MTAPQTNRPWMVTGFITVLALVLVVFLIIGIVVL